MVFFRLIEDQIYISVLKLNLVSFVLGNVKRLFGELWQQDIYGPEMIRSFLNAFSASIQ